MFSSYLINGFKKFQYKSRFIVSLISKRSRNKSTEIVTPHCPRSLVNKEAEPELSINRFLYSSDSILNRVLNQISDKHLIESMENIRHLYEYNVLKGKQNRGKLIVITYDILCEEPIQSVRDLAHVLGWVLEMFQAFALILDDIMDGSETRRKQLCWYKKVGLSAINDAILIQQQCYEIIRLYFSETKYYIKILEIINRASLMTTYGQMLDMTLDTTNNKINFEKFTKERLKSLYKYKTSYYTFVYPVKMGLILCDMETVEEWPRIESILLELGHLFQMRDDFIDCFGDPNITGKVGTDIEDGKCCWNVVTALQNCSEEQRKVLEECYGKSDKESVNTVKHIYRKLNLQKVFEDEFNKIESEIRHKIQTFDQSSNEKLTKLLKYILSKLSVLQTLQ